MDRPAISTLPLLPRVPPRARIAPAAITPRPTGGASGRDWGLVPALSCSLQRPARTLPSLEGQGRARRRPRLVIVDNKRCSKGVVLPGWPETALSTPAPVVASGGKPEPIANGPRAARARWSLIFGRALRPVPPEPFEDRPSRASNRFPPPDNRASPPPPIRGSPRHRFSNRGKRAPDSSGR